MFTPTQSEHESENSLWCLSSITVRKRSCGRVRFFTCLSVILFMRGRESLSQYAIGQSQVIIINRDPMDIHTSMDPLGMVNSGRYASYGITFLFFSLYFFAFSLISFLLSLLLQLGVNGPLKPVYTYRLRLHVGLGHRQSLTLCLWWLSIWRAEWVQNPFCPSNGPFPLTQW